MSRNTIIVLVYHPHKLIDLVKMFIAMSHCCLSKQGDPAPKLHANTLVQLQ
jgi:hypothetical protein